MRRPAALRDRLALATLAVTAIWVVAGTIAVNVGLRARLDARADDLLRSHAATVATALTSTDDGTVVLRDQQGAPALDPGVWVFQGSRLVAGGPAGPGAPTGLTQAAQRLVASGDQRTRVPGPTRLLAVRESIGRPPATVVVSLGLEPYEDVAEQALVGSLLLAVLALVAVPVVTRMVLGRALRPVTEMADRAVGWSAEDVDQRFGPAPRPTELAGLAHDLDGMLDRIGAVLRREQQVTADLSHELRTPLSRIAAEAELLAARPRSADEVRAAAERIGAGAAQMTSIVETLLTASRMDTGSLLGRCEVRSVVRASLAGRHAVEPVGPSAGITLLPGPPVPAGIAPEVLDRLLAPLLDNALRYAASQVTVDAHPAPSGGAVELLVADDGPGLRPGDEEEVFRPGRRSQPGDGHDGAGLGLALARRLARAAGGDVVALPRTAVPAGAGATFLVKLPPA